MPWFALLLFADDMFFIGLELHEFLTCDLFDASIWTNKRYLSGLTRDFSQIYTYAAHGAITEISKPIEDTYMHGQRTRSLKEHGMITWARPLARLR